MKRVWMTIAAVAALTIVGCSRPASTPNNTTIHVGVFLPLSGSMAEYGENGRNGLTLAQEELRHDNHAPHIDLNFQDSSDTPEGSVTAVRRLIDVDGVHFIIGGLTSSGVLAAAPYAQSHGVLLFTPAASAPGIPEIGDMVFRNWPGDDTIARSYGAWAYAQGARNIAVLSVSNDYGNTNANGFIATFTAAGGHVALKRTFAQGNTDFRTLVAQIAGTHGLDRVLVVGYPDEYRALFQQLRNSHLSTNNVMVSDTFYSPELAHQLGAQAEGVTVAVAAKPGDDYAPRQAFIAAYRARFHHEPGLVSDTAYDALRLVADAIAHTDGSPQAVSHYLLQVRDYQGAAGPTTFTATGDIPGTMAVYRVAAGAFVAQH